MDKGLLIVQKIITHLLQELVTYNTLHKGTDVPCLAHMVDQPFISPWLTQHFFLFFSYIL